MTNVRPHSSCEEESGRGSGSRGGKKERQGEQTIRDPHITPLAGGNYAASGACGNDVFNSGTYKLTPLPATQQLLVRLT